MTDQEPATSIEFLLGRLDSKVDLLLSANAEAAQDRSELTERVTALESSVSWVKGAAAVAGTVGAAVGALSAWLLQTFRVGI